MGGLFCGVCITVRSFDCTISSPKTIVNADTIIALCCSPCSVEESVMRSSQ